MRQILFIQGGGGHDVHHHWDNKLVDSLKRELGAGYEVRYPRMPAEDDPSYSRWAPAIGEELATLDDGAILVAHSIGAPILLNLLAENPPGASLGAIILVSAPFVGEVGWPGDEFALSRDLGARLPQGVPVHLFQGSKDEITPPAHADLYAAAIPQAEVHRLAGRDHQLNDDLQEVAAVVRSVEAMGETAAN